MPGAGEARVALSSFRRLEQLPGPAQPGGLRGRVRLRLRRASIPGLVSHDELDWAPLGLGGEATFLNLMTASVEPVEVELADLAARRIQAGEWPWSFFCYAGGAPAAGVPLGVPRARSGRARSEVGLAVRCPVCASVSINLVVAQHLDVPFHNDREIGVVAHIFVADAERAVEEFVAELYSARFDSRRLALQ